MAVVSAKQPGMGNCTGRADNTQENTKQEVVLIQEYCIPAKMSKLFHPKCKKWPRAFLCKYLKLLSNLPKASSSTVFWHCQPSQINLLSSNCLPGCFSPSSLPGCPSPGTRLPLLPAAGRPLVWQPGARCHPIGAGHHQEPGPGTSPLDPGPAFGGKMNKFCRKSF